MSVLQKSASREEKPGNRPKHSLVKDFEKCNYGLSTPQHPKAQPNLLGRTPSGAPSDQSDRSFDGAGARTLKLKSPSSFYGDF